MGVEERKEGGGSVGRCCSMGPDNRDREVQQGVAGWRGRVYELSERCLTDEPIYKLGLPVTRWVCVATEIHICVYMCVRVFRTVFRTGPTTPCPDQLTGDYTTRTTSCPQTRVFSCSSISTGMSTLLVLSVALSHKSLYGAIPVHTLPLHPPLQCILTLPPILLCYPLLYITVVAPYWMSCSSLAFASCVMPCNTRSWLKTCCGPEQHPPRHCHT